jgi:ribosomal-protein-alanine N-acetyltransferase
MERPGELRVALEQLGPQHEGPVLEFEVANRQYFSTFISDRGDDFFDSYPERHRELVAGQEAGMGAYYLLLDDAGAVLGRFNLRFVEDGVAEVGYRIAERAAGRGVATAGVRELCRLASSRHGVRRVRAAVSHANVASQRVLLKAGFVLVGPADPSAIGGKQGSWYALDLEEHP